MDTKTILRLEGVAVFAAATVAFSALEASLWLYLALILAPDLGMLGYLAGPRAGSWTYNLLHAYVGPLALVSVGVWASVGLAVPVALVWTAHVGADRALGYGLKEATGFGDTHIGRIGSNRGDLPATEPLRSQ